MSSAPAPPRASSASRVTARRSIAVFAVGLALTFVATLFAINLARGRAELAFEERAVEVAQRVERELTISFELVYTAAALFEASEQVTREEFATFAAPALERHKNMRSLLWVPKVPLAQRAAFEKAAIDRDPDFAIFEVDDGGERIAPQVREVSYPITLIHPHRAHVVGLDLGFERDESAWFARAEEEASLMVTERFELAFSAEPAVAAVFPVYRGEERRTARQAAGVVMGVYRLEEMVGAMIPPEEREHVDVILKDDTGGILFAGPGSLESSAPSWNGPVSVGSRSWTLQLTSKNAVDPTLPMVVGGLGVFLSILAAVGVAVFFRFRALTRSAQKLGQYVVLEKLGEGGMGTVYRAKHAFLRRPTAIKLLRHGSEDEHAHQRFEREVQAASELTHPNSITVYDYGWTPDGLPYYAMEYVPGIDLRELVTRYGPLPAGRVVHVLSQVSGALVEAHSRGLVHRDIKPGNIMICDRGAQYDFAKLLDFGLVRRHETDEDLKVSKDVKFVGTPKFMAPEQLVGPADVSPRTDIYAMGCVAYYLLTGLDVFDAETAAQIGMKHVTVIPEKPSFRTDNAIPQRLEGLVMRCLEKAQEDRPESAQALQDELRACEVKLWTRRDAARWWEEHPQASTRAIVEGDQTVIDVDVARRAVVSAKAG